MCPRLFFRERERHPDASIRRGSLLSFSVSFRQGCVIQKAGLFLLGLSGKDAAYRGTTDVESSVSFRHGGIESVTLFLRKQTVSESGERWCGGLPWSIQTLQCLNPCSWRRAQNSAEHFHKCGGLAVSQRKADFLDRIPRDKQFDSLHQAHLPPPKLEVRTDFSTKDSLNCPDASTGRSAHFC